MQKRVIMTVGLNHSGKTTFARRLKHTLSNCILIDNDPFIYFAEWQYPELVKRAKEITSEMVEWSSKYNSNLPLRNAYQKRIIDYGLGLDFHVIVATCNSIRAGREKLIASFRDHNAKIILCYINTPKDQIYKRIEAWMPDKDESTYSRWFKWNFERQLTYFESPSSNEADYYYEIIPESNIDLIIESINNLIHHSHSWN